MSSSADTRETIRRAAYACFRNHGYHETSVDAICRAAGASKGSFYYHYASKQLCFVDILDTWTREVMSEVQKQFEEATQQAHPFDALKAAFRREQQRGRLIVPLWLEFTAMARREPEVQKVLARFYHRARLAIAEMLRPFVSDAGAVRPTEIDGLAAAIFGVFFGTLVQEISDPEHSAAREATDAVLSVMARALLEQRPVVGAIPATTQARAASTVGERLPERAFEGFVASATGPVRQLMAELRELVQAEAPAADERLIRGWRVIAWDHGGLFCSLKPQRGAVDVGFYRGVELDDPDGLLEGRGKRGRHVRVAAGGPIPEAALAGLIRQAFALQRGAA